MVTEYGKFMKNLRKQKNETLATMSEKLGVSIAFLSAMEVGKKQVPIDYADKISDIYGLSNKENLELTNAIALSNINLNINFASLNEDQTKTLVLFARKINKIDKRKLDKINSLLLEDEFEF